MPLSYSTIDIDADITLNRHIHANGPTLRFTSADGDTVTLPASAGTGDIYEFFVGTTVSSNDDIIQVASASDIIQGVIGVATDAAGVNIPTAATSDTITMNGSTKGGVIGSRIVLKDVATGVWAVSGALVSTGVEATPFSADVS